MKLVTGLEGIVLQCSHTPTQDPLEGLYKIRTMLSVLARFLLRGCPLFLLLFFLFFFFVYKKIHFNKFEEKKNSRLSSKVCRHAMPILKYIKKALLLPFFQKGRTLNKFYLLFGLRTMRWIQEWGSTSLYKEDVAHNILVMFTKDHFLFTGRLPVGTKSLKILWNLIDLRKSSLCFHWLNLRTKYAVDTENTVWKYCLEGTGHYW